MRMLLLAVLLMQLAASRTTFQQRLADGAQVSMPLWCFMRV
jgi:hypothetical protein